MAILTVGVLLVVCALLYLAGAVQTFIYFSYDDDGTPRPEWQQVSPWLRVLLYVAWPALVLFMLYVVWQMAGWKKGK